MLKDTIIYSKMVANFFQVARRNIPKEIIIQVTLCITRQTKKQNIAVCALKLEIVSQGLLNF